MTNLLLLPIGAVAGFLCSIMPYQSCTVITGKSTKKECDEKNDDSIDEMYSSIKRMHEELELKLKESDKNERIATITKLVEHAIRLEKSKELNKDKDHISQLDCCMGCYFFNKK